MKKICVLAIAILSVTALHSQTVESIMKKFVSQIEDNYLIKDFYHTADIELTVCNEKEELLAALISETIFENQEKVKKVAKEKKYDTKTYGGAKMEGDGNEIRYLYYQSIKKDFWTKSKFTLKETTNEHFLITVVYDYFDLDSDDDYYETTFFVNKSDYNVEKVITDLVARKTPKLYLMIPIKRRLTESESIALYNKVDDKYCLSSYKWNSTLTFFEYNRQNTSEPKIMDKLYLTSSVNITDVFYDSEKLKAASKNKEKVTKEEMLSLLSK